jgi:hypothetical protein
VGYEEKTAPAVADAGIFTLEPGTLGTACSLRTGLMLGVFEWIFDHGDRDPSVPSLLLQ